MSGLIQHSGIAALLPRDNIDTDQIIPSREMKKVSKLGLSDGLFAGQRYRAPGSRKRNPDFILNQPPYDQATILLSGKNFGCGSSREHAVWALAEFGIKVIIAESFGEIFYNNCVRNGILPIQLPPAAIAELAAAINLTIDLEATSVTATQGGDSYKFDMAPSDRDMLLKGLDPIAMTLTHEAAIKAFLKKDRAARPWVY